MPAFAGESSVTQVTQEDRTRRHSDRRYDRMTHYLPLACLRACSLAASSENFLSSAAASAQLSPSSFLSSQCLGQGPCP